MAQKASLTLVGRDTNGETVSTTISQVNPYLMDGDSSTTLQNMTSLDNGMRSLNSLTRNTYVDTIYNVTYELDTFASGA